MSDYIYDQQTGQFIPPPPPYPPAYYAQRVPQRKSPLQELRELRQTPAWREFWRSFWFLVVCFVLGAAAEARRSPSLYDRFNSGQMNLPMPKPLYFGPSPFQQSANAAARAHFNRHMAGSYAQLASYFNSPGYEQARNFYLERSLDSYYQGGGR